MDADHTALCTRLGHELVRLGMNAHSRHLREYMANARHGHPPTGDGAWTREHVEDVARMLRVAPFENFYKVKARMSSCGCSRPSPSTRAVWPGGSLRVCGKCHETWIELG